MSLKDYLLSEKPTSRTSMIMLTQLLEAVEFLFKNKIAHRDLKCDNILLNLEHGMSHIISRLQSFIHSFILILIN